MQPASGGERARALSRVRACRRTAPVGRMVLLCL